jgi:ApaG protein
MTHAITKNIGISVKSLFHSLQSSSDFEYYIYSYQITIVNEGEHAVQLLSRFWEIFDSPLEKRIVKGEGVVGEQPMIQPGKSYQYVSFCQLKSDGGSMKGYYTFRSELDNLLFNVAIPEFILLPNYRNN